MLGALRRGTKNWIVKAFLMIIGLSFALWGIGDVFTGLADVTLASVGERKIKGAQFLRAFQTRIENLQQQTKTGITTEMARSFGLDRQVLREMIGIAAFQQHMRQLDMSAGDADVAERIRQQKRFQSQFGGFDRVLYDSQFGGRSAAEESFVGAMRQEIMFEQLSTTLSAGYQAPKLMTEQLFQFRGERRSARIMIIPNAKVELAAPDQAALEAYHRDNAEAFTAPVYRELTFLSISPQDLVSEVTVTEEDLREAYQTRLSEFTVEELRDVDQMVLLEKTAALEAHRRLLGGADFTALAQQLTGLGAADISLGRTDRSGVLPEAAQAIFSTHEGGFTAPVQSGFGWHIFRVRKIYQGAQLSFADARDQLERTVALDLAHDSLYSLSNSLADSLSGGATLEEAANNLNLRITTLEAVDQRGRGRDGQPLLDLPKAPNFLTDLFESEIGVDIELPETDSGAFYVFRVNDEIPTALRPFAEVRDQVAAAWRQAERAEATRKKAEEMMSGLKLGTPLEQLARPSGYLVKVTNDLSRDGRNRSPELSLQLIVALFQLARGEATSGPSGDGSSHIVARLTSITAADASNSGDFQAVREQIKTAAQDDLFAQYQEAIFRDLGLVTNYAGLDLVFDGGFQGSSGRF